MHKKSILTILLKEYSSILLCVVHASDLVVQLCGFSKCALHSAENYPCNTVDSRGFEVNCKKLQGMAWVGAVVVAVAAAAGGPAATGGVVDRSVDPTAAGGCDAPKLSFHALQVMGRATRLVFALRI